jgi:hypothetical protein
MELRAEDRSLNILEASVGLFGVCDDDDDDDGEGGGGGVFSSACRRVEDDSDARWTLCIECRHDEHIVGRVSRDNDMLGGIVECN